MKLPAFHLPALEAPPTTSWPYPAQGAGTVELRVAQLAPGELTRQVDALLAAREAYLVDRPVASIAAAVGRVADRFLDPADSLRVAAETALPPVTGYSPPMAVRILERMAADWREDRLMALLAAEFGEPGVLDGFRALPGGRIRRRAVGPRLSLHVFGGNVPGVGVTSLIRTLLLKSASLAKTAAGEPVLAALFARGVAEIDPELGACLAVTYWPGGDEELERGALARADAVIAYGGSEAIRSLRERTPTSTRFLGYGHRLSFGVLAREALGAADADRLATAAALDVATFDQHGCVSPHLFYVEAGGEVEPAEWARLLALAMERLERTLPRGTLAPGESAAIRQARGEIEFAQLAGRGHQLHASPGSTAWTVAFDPDPTFQASCLNRLVRVKPVRQLEDVAVLAAPIADLLQTVGLAGPPQRLEPLAGRLARLGASRLVPLGEMAWPPPDWHHDGRPPLRELVHWCDWE